MNLSQGAIDYISAYRGTDTTSYLSILAAVRSTLLFSSGSKYYRIEGGNDRLIDAMISECQAIEFNRCSIEYAMPITQIQLYDSNQTQWITRNGTTDIFNSIIVATTPVAAQLIDYNPQIEFIEKYRALRQVHFACATKVLLFFNVSWWYTQENINGGQSFTDLNLRQVYYRYTTDNQTNGGTILAVYTTGHASILWQSLSDAETIELVLKQLIQLHKFSSNLRDYIEGVKVHHWCQDPYAHGAFVTMAPLQETRLLSRLQTSIANVHFIGEYTSMIHGWVEGAIVSALRGALEITEQKKRIFDVIIVGGDPVGLITAIFLSQKQSNLRIAIIDNGIINNSVNTLNLQQFRQMFNEEYLAELANMSFFSLASIGRFAQHDIWIDS